MQLQTQSSSLTSSPQPSWSLYSCYYLEVVNFKFFPSHPLLRANLCRNLTLPVQPKHLTVSKSSVSSATNSAFDDDANGLSEFDSPPTSSTCSDNDWKRAGGEHDDDDDDFEFEIEKTRKNGRRILSKIVIKANLQTVWDILTDYERLAEFIPGLAVSQLLEKRHNFARLYQIGQQNLAFGIKFDAKGIIDCYESDIQSLPYGERRDIEFRMIEGDFQCFEGKWSVEQCNVNEDDQSHFLVGEENFTTLLYVVDVEPKPWLPVRLVEARLCREIKKNLVCIRAEAQKSYCKNIASN